MDLGLQRNRVRLVCRSCEGDAPKASNRGYWVDAEISDEGGRAGIGHRRSAQYGEAARISQNGLGMGIDCQHRENQQTQAKHFHLSCRQVPVFTHMLPPRLALFGHGPLPTVDTLAQSLMLSRLIIFATSCKHLQPPHKPFSPKKMVEITARLRFGRIPVADNYPDCREQHVTQV